MERKNRKAVVIGASSGMGLEIAKLLSKEGYKVGLAARRIDSLEKLLDELPSGGCAIKMDVADNENAPAALDSIIEKLGGMDIIYICAGVDFFSKDLKWSEVRESIDVNVGGFAAVAGRAFDYFAAQGHGHIVGISSVACLRGSPSHPAYCASKAFVSNYMEGLRMRAKKKKLNICVTDIRPGYVDTPMSAGQPGKFWELSASEAAEKIYRAALKKKNISYLTCRWDLIARVMRNLPAGLYAKI